MSMNCDLGGTIFIDGCQFVQLLCYYAKATLLMNKLFIILLARLTQFCKPCLTYSRICT